MTKEQREIIEGIANQLFAQWETAALKAQVAQLEAELWR